MVHFYPLTRLLPFAPLLLACAAVLSAQRTGLPAAEAISRLTASRAESITGNSVDTGTGGFSLEATALQVQGGRSLAFILVYDSIKTPGSTGQWTHNYTARIQGQPGGPVTVHWDDHRSNRFGFSGGVYRPLDESNRYDRIEAVNGAIGCSQCAWRVTREDGTRLQFDAQGTLLRIGNKINQFLDVEKTDGRLTRVIEPISSRTLDFTYGPGNRIQYVSDPAGRRAYLEYDELGRLVLLHNPASFSNPIIQPAVLTPIPDNGVLERTITISGRPEEAGVVVLEGTSLTHARPADIRVVLISPSGTEVNVTDLAAHPTPTVFNFGAVALSRFHGEPANGTWTLRIRDQQAGSTGDLLGFGLRVSEPTYPTRFSYGAGSRLVQAVDSDGRQLFANVYDSLGRVSAQDDGRQNTPLATFAYQEIPQGIVTTYKDRLGFSYVYEHDANYRLVRYADPLEGETLYEYSSGGDRTAIVDALGRRTQFQHDLDGNITQVTDAAGNVSRMTYTSPKNLSTFTDAEGAVTNFNFNDGNITAVLDAEGNRDTHQYGGNGLLTNLLLHDGAGVNLTYAKGQISTGHMLHGPSTGGATYDDIGLPSEIADGLGNKIRLEYDGRGNVVRRTDPLGETETMEYDARNRLVQTVDKNGNASRFEFDGNNNLIERTNALGQTVRLVYDAGDRLVETIDTRGGSSKRAYDAVGRVISETNAAGDTIRRRYDEVGNLLAVIDAKGAQAAAIAYNQLDLAVSTTDALGNVSQTRYDRLQRPIELIDPLGRSTELTYDKLGRLVTVEDAAGRTTSQAYFSDDLVRSMTDGAGDESSFSYDQQNRVTAFTPPTGSVAGITWTYDERGLPTRERLPGGGEKTYTYDDAGRLEQISYSGEGALPTRQYAYDANGNLTTVRSGSQTQLRRTFDALNRVASFTDAHGDTLRYSYDANGNLTRLTYPDGKTVDYSYDAANRLVAAVDWAQRRTTFGYDASSLLSSIGFPNGASRQMIYDAGGRLIRRRDLSASGAPIVDYRYRYDAVGLITEELSGAGSPTAYSPAAMSFTYRNDGRFQTINGSAASYDARGNLTSLPSGGGFANLAYDANGNLQSGAGVAYEYDAEDRLIAWTASGGRTRFTVNPHGPLDQVLVQRAPNGAATRFVYGGGLLYEESGSGIRVYHYDQRGSAIAFSGDAGGIIGTAAYGPFGEALPKTGQADSIFQFCGLYGVITDPSGLNYMRFRWYSPQLKRFLSPDSHYGDIADPASLNRYAYAGNNPVNFIDPNGEFLGALIGAVAGAVINTVAVAVTAAVTGQPLTPGDLIGAAVGGAITGGLIGACGPACAGAGSFLAASIGASVLGGAAGNALGQGIDIAFGFGGKTSFDLESFGVEVAASAVFGALPFGKGAKGAVAAARGLGEAGEAVAKRGARSSTTKLLRGVAKTPSPGGSAPIAVPWRASLKGAGKPAGGGLPSVAKSAGPGGVSPIAVPGALAAAGDAAKEGLELSAKDLLADFGVAVGQGVFVNVVVPDTSAPAPGNPGASRDALTVRQSGLRELNAGNRSVFGEYFAWRFYQAAHTLAGRALPNNPNPALPQF